MNRTLYTCAAATALCVGLAGAPAAWGAFTYTLVPNSVSSWGALTDTQLGVAGYQIETFESTTLNAGLRIGWTAQGVTQPASSTLPRTFNPATDDAGGTAFLNGGAWGGGVWDGRHGIINHVGNGPIPVGGYGPFPNPWGALRVEFTQPVRSVGFSFQQAELLTNLSINGVPAGTLQSLFGFATSGQRHGYLRIDATGGDSIAALDLFNNCPTSQHGSTGCDGWMLDHLAFDPIQTGVIPVPAALPLFLSGIGLLAWRTRRRG